MYLCGFFHSEAINLLLGKLNLLTFIIKFYLFHFISALFCCDFWFLYFLDFSFIFSFFNENYILFSFINLSM